MQDILNGVGVVFGAWCLIRCMERLRHINWFNAKPAIVTMYLAGALWSIWIIGDSVLYDLEWYQLAALVFVACVICITRKRWEGGMPRDVSTEPDNMSLAKWDGHERRGSWK